jgi:hypothetical protein
MANKKPEAKVVIELKKFFRKHDDWFDVHVIEAKANFSEKTGRYTSGAVAAGYPDMSGNDKFGNALFIEVKAPGKLKTLRLGQYMFLKRKIEMNCFACCVDSIDMFSSIYKEWLKTEHEKKEQFLLSRIELSKKLQKEVDDNSPLFDD